MNKFLPILKADQSAIPFYPCHVALLVRSHVPMEMMYRCSPIICMYCRTVVNYKDRMHKGFDTWLQMKYHDGKPSVTELQSILQEEDCRFCPILPNDIPFQGSPAYVERDGPEDEGVYAVRSPSTSDQITDQ